MYFFTMRNIHNHIIEYLFFDEKKQAYMHFIETCIKKIKFLIENEDDGIHPQLSLIIDKNKEITFTDFIDTVYNEIEDINAPDYNKICSKFLI